MTEQERFYNDYLTIDSVVDGLEGLLIEFKAHFLLHPKSKDITVMDKIAILTKAIEFLKAQEPRVYTVDELKVDNNICCWLEFEDVEEDPGIIQLMPVVRTDMHEDFDVEFDSGLCVSYGFNYDNYNETWRCWTSRPTDEQRRDEPWNE